MRTRHISLLLGSVLGMWACGASEGDDPELASLTEGIAKGNPGAVNGDYNYCSNPLALCVQGEGDCSGNATCTGGTICGRDNGPKFGFSPGSDVCVPETCGNKVKDGTETQIDCGGLCGPICGLVCPPNANPAAGHCTTDCPCPIGEGDCNSNSQCQTGLVCASTGNKYNMPPGYLACTPPSCVNNVLDAPNETAIDCGGTCGTCPPATTFTPLGDLPGGIFYSEANAVSNEGYAVVGNSTSANGTEAFVWTKSGGVMVGLGDLPGGAGAAPFRSIAYAVNSGASVVIGTGRSANGVEAFRWTEDEGMVGLGDLAGGAFKSEGWGANSNGTVVVGPSAGPTGETASRWTGSAWVALPILPGATSSRAYASNASGDAVVGRSGSPTGTQAFRWTTSVGIAGLGDFSGGAVASVALGVTGTGGSVVGYGTDAVGTRAFRWSTSTGMVKLPLPAGTTTSFAHAISNDGTIVVGTATGASNVAFVWYSTTNTSVPLSTVLGASLPAGWTLNTAVGISYDGKHVVGTGTNPSGQTEAWLARIAL